jgi:hypothetical protein
MTRFAPAMLRAARRDVSRDPARLFRVLAFPSDHRRAPRHRVRRFHHLAGADGGGATTGNLTPPEAKLVDDLLYELRMRFMQAQQGDRRVVEP